MAKIYYNLIIHITSCHRHITYLVYHMYQVWRFGETNKILSNDSFSLLKMIKLTLTNFNSVLYCTNWLTGSFETA